MNLCSANKSVDIEVGEFIRNVNSLKEESITDFLVWQWRKLDKRFNYISVSPFDREQESKLTGADYAMELWVVGKTHAIPLLFQAKKIIKPFNAYKAALNYPDNTNAQMRKLLQYAKKTRKLPFYMFYSMPGSGSKTMCAMGLSGSNVTVFMADALEVRAMANSSVKKLSRDDILAKSNPFQCLFCCPLSAMTTNGTSDLEGLRNYFERYFPKLTEVPRLRDNMVSINKVDATVQSLLEGITPDEPPRRPCRIVATLKISG